MSGNNGEMMIGNKSRKKGQARADQRLFNERNKIINNKYFLGAL